MLIIVLTVKMTITVVKNAVISYFRNYGVRRLGPLKRN